MCNSFALIFRNPCLMPALVSWAVAQILKVLLILLTRHKLDPTRFIGSGGMPSAHSAFVCALSIATGMNCGFDSGVFAVAAALAIVVMYDAAGVRRAAGQQAEKINKIIEHLIDKSAGYQDTEKQLRELLGHTPLEVFAGACLGILIAVLWSI